MRKYGLAVISVLAFGLAAPLAALAADNNAGTPENAATAPAQPNGAKTATPASGVHHAAMSHQRVEHVQKLLVATGAKIPVDGIWGARTEDALKTFQQQHSLKATGHLDAATMKKLQTSSSA